MQSLTRFFIVSIATAVFLGSCSSVGNLSAGGIKISQTPITANPTGEIYPGRVVWHELLTPDPLSAGKFYEELFGWQIDYQGEYAVVRNGDKLIAGILRVEPSDEHEREGIWIPSVSVADVDAAASLVMANGGLVLNGPVDMDLRGRAVLISDPQRADLVLLSAKGGDPVDAKTAIGDWLWDEIWSNDAKKTEAFYASVLGYDEVLSSDDYDVLMHEGKWRVGIRHVRDDSRHLLWVPVVRVTDPVVTSQRAKELGGVVWLTPDEIPGDSNTALISDTTGALFLIQQWPNRTSKGGQ